MYEYTVTKLLGNYVSQTTWLNRLFSFQDSFRRLLVDRRNVQGAVNMSYLKSFKNFKNHYDAIVIGVNDTIISSTIPGCIIIIMRLFV